MAEEVLDAHEQGEAVRKWLQNNGSSILIGVAVGLAALFGYQRWQDSKLSHAGEAMLQFQQLQSAAESDPAGFEAYLGALSDSYKDTPYGALALMADAERKLQAGDNQAAVAALRQAADVGQPESVANVARLRLARALIASGDVDEALRQLDRTSKDGFKALRAELRGDALLAKGDSDAARTAYEEALSHLDVGAMGRNIVEIKMANAGTVAAAPAAPEMPAEVAPAPETPAETTSEGASS
ncbi:MAG: tetratricopeptide repeat protein [Xanthomonadales bacterium]|nr:tetratricopeptide repeat protein [Xanthomonadales bacterium]MCB1633948.1 tetratricopeptide repeat protein [Xanthomonadales bacterium]